MQPSKKTDLQQKWTLRLKLHKTTVMLLVNPTQSFLSIKQELLEAIRATGRNDIAGNVLPSDPEDVLLGVPIDKNNPGRGWVNLRIPEANDGDDGKRPKGVKKDSVFNSSPSGAGLKDGAMIAFKFKAHEEEDAMSDHEWDVILPNDYDESQEPMQT